MKHFFQRITLSLLLFGVGLVVDAQNVGINATGAAPNASAGLDINFTNKGLLIPNVSLSGTASNSPIGTGIATSLLVYNVATVSDVTPGYYYWDGTMWVRLLNGESTDWKLAGNAGTTAGTDFIGTTDAVDWVMKTNNTERARIGATGNFLIGTTTDIGSLFNLQVANKILLRRYGGNPIIRFDRANGTMGSETQILNLDRVANYNYNVWDGSTYSTIARFYVEAQENHTGASMASGFVFETTPPNVGTAQIRALEISANGNVAIGGFTPDASALLDVASTSKGVLVPRMTSAQKTAIAAPATGLLIYQTDGSKGFYYYDGTAWIPLLSSSATGFGGWTLTGNSGTTAGTNFIGTTDAVDWVVKTNNVEGMRLTAGSDVGIGTNAPSVHLEVAGTDLSTSTIRSARYSADNQPAYFMFRKSRNATIGSHTILQDNDYVGSIRFAGSDGTNYLVGASILAEIDGVPSLGNMPTEIRFQTSSSDRMTIRNSGKVGIGTTSPSARLQVSASSGEDGLRVQINGSTKLYTTSNGGTSVGAFTAATTNGLRVAGDANIIGNLTKGGGTFKIDHPLDPENKYLYHSFVESPDMMNIYNGNITTNGNGEAVVQLPDYFETLNMDFRYQLTVLGVFAQAIVSQEIVGNQFKIKTNEPNVKVSWQVTGVRQDPYANQNRVVPEVEKEKELKGYYLHPTAYGLSEEKSISRAKEEKMTEELKHQKVKEENTLE